MDGKMGYLGLWYVNICRNVVYQLFSLKFLFFFSGLAAYINLPLQTFKSLLVAQGLL